MYLSHDQDIIKVSSGTRNVVGVKVKIDRSKLVVGARVALDQTTLTIMRVLPREVDPMVFNMMNEDPGKVDFSDIGGLGDQLRILRETV
jgi:26S proteasome regulatory subunit T4